MTQARDRLVAFERDNAAELATVQRDWNALVREAAADPEASSLGIR